MTTKPIPDGYTSVAPYLMLDDAKAAMEFYKRAFGATDHGAIVTPDGKVAHAELKIGDTVIRLCDKLPQFHAEPPKVLGGTTVEIFMFVEDVDAVVRRAADAGATVEMEPQDHFWGDRMGQVTDPFGHFWSIATRVEDLTPEEIEARQRQLFGGGS
jgi:PhnB protein